MEKTALQKNDRITPDQIRIKAWGYDFSLFRTRTTAFCFDGERVYKCDGPVHRPTHLRLKTDSLLDFRYYSEPDVLSVWVYDKGKIVEQLRAFERVYSAGDWKPFDIDTVSLVYSSDGYAIKERFSELDNGCVIDENDFLRPYHTLPPSLKPFVANKDWKREYFKDGERSWIMKHGDIDPTLYHLLMYEE